ncbi:hypothetical protein [Atopomonas hussainii]|uniref:hypothetical protein n=1 Tax=Atopomonas hussainii TaxID=1429083 RepID=UPI0009000152|nr:hypothetical protein [Atopomonas hussainii]
MSLHLNLPSSPALAEFSEWNRFPLPERFVGCIERSAPLLAAQAQQVPQEAWLGVWLAGPFAERSLGVWLDAPWQHACLRAWQALREPPRIWLECPANGDWRALLPMVQRYPKVAVQLSVDLSSRDCLQIDVQLRELSRAAETLQPLGVPLDLRLQDVAQAMPAQLYACVEFARHLRWLRLTLCDVQARLTPMGVRNLLQHLHEQFAEVFCSDLQLAFHGSDRRGLAQVNGMAALAHGAQFVHGSVVLPQRSARPCALLPLLRNYVYPQAAEVESYGEALGEVTGWGCEPTRSDNPAAPADNPVLQSLQRMAQAREQRHTPHFIFQVSADDWHVRLSIELQEQRIDLGERVHHYVLLLLARAYCQQWQCYAERDPDPLSLGWVEREALHKMLGDSETQFNVKVFRAVKQISCTLAKAGLEGFKPILTRVGSMRWACSDFTIFKDSTLECAVKQWRRVDVGPPG